jgi:hemerythrin-like domain-containing protein
MPTPAIELLMQEHRLIERVLEALVGCAGRLERGEPVERASIADFGEFFSKFADARHHGKEEDGLFAAMVEHGFASDSGPIGVMLLEHTEGRSHVGALRRIGQGSGPLTPPERAEAAEHGRAFAYLLRDHILKEDEILYPMAERTLPGPVLHGLTTAFEQRDAESPDGDGRKYRELAEKLSAMFPA